jgi:hypothetical protein
MAGRFTINLGFDAVSMARLGQLAKFEAWLAASFIGEAMPQSLDELEQASQSMMFGNFINPTGNVESSFTKTVDSPWRAELGNDAPYAQRLNYGFSGMTDSLGRTYSFWPAYHWAQGAIEMATPYITDIFKGAVNQSIEEMVL